MAMVSVVLVAAYRWIWGSDRLVWSKGRQPPGTRAALAKWTGWTLAVAVYCYDDSTINSLRLLLLLCYYIGFQLIEKSLTLKASAHYW